MQSLTNLDAQDHELLAQYESFKTILIDTLTMEEFADIYAQTVTYGLFTARYFDQTGVTFSRQEAQNLIPRTNPFLRKLFYQIGGLDLDANLTWIIDNLVELFLHTDVHKLMEGFGRATQQNDPILHFYETFLGEYDPALRKKRGVYYTPEPVVSYIVRSVDEILKRDFGLEKGLADNSKIEVEVDDPKTLKKIKKKVHRVQVLDPATGTGTFLYEVIQHIYNNYFEHMKGAWSDYVHRDLIPRIHGFELMMASYTMAHLKLAMLLEQTGYHGDDRLSIYLTNSLEQTTKSDGSLFGNWLTDEAHGASVIKNETPIMVVMGNPPYSLSSNNKSAWILNLLKDYKKDLNEKKINLDDDYIKFIRFAEHLVEKNGEGVVAFISNNSFIDGITHRQMRKHLMQTFNKIYILDLHGNSKKKEVAPDGGKDENVFDIQQGVSINIFVKQKGKYNGDLAKVYHSELWGKRESKYFYLSKERAFSNNYSYLLYSEAGNYFVPKNNTGYNNYSKYISIVDLFRVYNSGVKTDRDALFIDDDRDLSSKRIQILLSGNLEQKFIEQYNVKDTSSYKIIETIRHLHFNQEFIQKIQYRPFDYKWIYYDQELISRPAKKIFTSKKVDQQNLFLVTTRQLSTFDFQHVLISKNINDICLASLQTKETGYCFPLNLYESDGTRVSNLKKELLPEWVRGYDDQTVFDYIYAVLHSPSYREKYKEFLKTDFPRIPFSDWRGEQVSESNAKFTPEFERLAKLGEQLRLWHLLEHADINKHNFAYPVDGGNVVEKPKFEPYPPEVTPQKDDLPIVGRVYINPTQYFDNIAEVAWNFYIGGYQPAQKWLKDRKSRNLSYDDIQHYQRITNSLIHTHKLMKEIE